MSPRPKAPLTIEYILLGFAAQGPVHGYDLHRQISTLEGISSIWRIKQSQVYALLDKLEALGYLQAETAPGSGFAPRREYSLTASGRQAFEAWRVSPVARPRQVRQEFLARLYFARLAGTEVTSRLVEAQYIACLGWREELQAQLAQLSDPHSFQRIVDEYRLSQVEAILKWLELCRPTPAQ
jgi:DNA-binding PadR family transcriptional regulator